MKIEVECSTPITHYVVACRGVGVCVCVCVCVCAVLLSLVNCELHFSLASEVVTEDVWCRGTRISLGFRFAADMSL